jgi:hypothetical protein
MEHMVIGFYNQDEKHLLLGVTWVCKQNNLLLGVTWVCKQNNLLLGVTWVCKQNSLLLGVTWVCKQNSLQFVFRGLNNTFELFFYTFILITHAVCRERERERFFMIGVLCCVTFMYFFFQIGNGVIRSLLQPGCTMKMYVIEKSSNGLGIMKRGIVHFQYTC